MTGANEVDGAGNSDTPGMVRLTDGLGLLVGVRYIVTRASKDREFQIGDHVWLDDDGSIMCREAAGWMPPEDVQAATSGMAVEVDAAWASKRSADLERQLAALHTNRSAT